MPHHRRSRVAALLVAATVPLAGAVTLAPAAAAAIPAGSTVRVNVASDGTQANDYSALPTISRDGNVVVFQSSATNLAPGYPTGGIGPAIYAHDLRTGLTTAVDVAADGRSAADHVGEYDVSGDGNRVVFGEDDLDVMAPGAPKTCARPVRGDTPEPVYCINVFVRDRAAGTTARVSVAADGGEPDGESRNARISADGRYVVFTSTATNLVPGDVNGVSDVFLRDLATGTTTRIDPGNDAPGSSSSHDAAISADGRWIAYLNDGIGTGLAPVAAQNSSTILLYDRVAGTTSTLDAHPADGATHAAPLQLSLSGDGTLVGFGAYDASLVPGDTNDNYDVYVYDRAHGTLTMADRNADGRQAGYADRIHFSADGHYALFRAAGSTGLTPDSLRPGDTYGYVRDLTTGALQLVTVASDGSVPNDNSDVWIGSISGDGARVAFWSRGTNLAAGDTNGTDDVFVRALRDVPVPPGAADTTVTGGGTVSTDPTGAGATPDVPVQTSITAPASVSGAISVTPQPSITTAPPAGYDLVGKQLVLEGPAATPQAPYQVTFTVDAATLGAVAAADVQVFRNGAAVADCTDPTAAVPDPCVVSRRTVSTTNPDAVITVRTSHFSTWNLGTLHYALSGPFAPVDAFPTVNTAKAGSAIPVKFRLGGDKGMAVLAAGYPVVRKLTGCAGTTAEVEQTVALDAPVLSYDRASTTYSYVWKTAKTLTGCADLVLRFRDGSQLQSRFQLR